MKNTLFATLFSILFISCSGTTKQYISPEYQGANSEESVSLLVIEKEDFSERFPDHEFGELRINEQPIFKERLISLFRQATDANVNGEIRSMELDHSSFAVRKFTEGGTDLQFLAPSEGTVLQTEENQPRFVFLLDGFRFDSYEEYVGGDSYAGHEPEIIPRLTFETNYLIWDNNTRKAIAWGTIDADKVIELARIQTIYDSLIIESLEEMGQRSPFTRNDG